MSPWRWLSCAVGLTATASACSIQVVPTLQERVATNQCTTNADCGSGATCTTGVCFSNSGSIDDVLLEIVPDAASSRVGGLSFLSAESGVGHGEQHLDITLAPASFNVQVQVAGADLPSDKCPYVAMRSLSIQATLEFARSSSMGGFAILGLPKVPITFDTRLQNGSWVRAAALAPGTYDIYIEPKSSPNCAFAPKMLRGVEVSSDVVGSAPPATLKLPTPLNLSGKVQRYSSNPLETLAGWQVDLIEPQDGRVISTSVQWPSGVPAVTNFSIDYQPVSIMAASSSASNNLAANSPILRIRPPDAMAFKAPTVYWVLSTIDLNGDGSVSLDLSGLPTSDRLVSVSGRVTGAGSGVPTALQFLSVSLEGTKGLTASFNQSVTADANGAYTTTLFPGRYKLIAAPNRGLASAGETGVTASTWAITTQEVPVQAGSDQTLDVVELSPKRVVQASVSAGARGGPAFGATIEAVPAFLPDNLGVLRGALAQTPILPDTASASVSPVDASFSLLLDPGVFDLSVRPSDGSNFAWWVSPGVQITAPSAGESLQLPPPHLPYPVALQGKLQGVLDNGKAPLPNAVVRAYAKVAGGTGVAKVGDTRTDSAGHYLLALPSTLAH
jgi:hypothetical protein